LQKRGKNRGGSQRYFCPNCGVSQTRKRLDITRQNHFAIYLEWLTGKLSLDELGRKYGVTRQTLDNWFAPFRKDEILPEYVNCRGKVLVSDGYAVHYRAWILIVILPTNRPVTWLFTQRENTNTWSTCFNQIKDIPLAIVLDGKAGGIKAAKERWPKIIIQRCQFHVIHYVGTLLTKNPETTAARRFKGLVGKITMVHTLDDWQCWCLELKKWYQTYGSFLQEKTIQENSFTPTGRHKWHYTHGHLHAAFFHVEHAFPYLFQYLKYPQIPNTSNRVEGSVNSFLQRKLDLHRGLNLQGQRQLISVFLKLLQQKYR
jgi:hypothetical protein